MISTLLILDIKYQLKKKSYWIQNVSQVSDEYWVGYKNMKRVFIGSRIDFIFDMDALSWQP